jgi:hypothetical protein
MCAVFRAQVGKTVHKRKAKEHAAEHPELVEGQANSTASGTLWVMPNNATA